MGVVILSTVVFILSTMPELTDDIDLLPNTNVTGGKEVARWDEVRGSYFHFLKYFYISIQVKSYKI